VERPPHFAFALVVDVPNFPQKYFKKMACFPPRKNIHPKHHNSPAIHHNFTTKNHHESTRFLKNPLKKRHSTTPKKNPKTTSSP
jgi:hypothetical protein